MPLVPLLSAIANLYPSDPRKNIRICLIYQLVNRRTNESSSYLIHRSISIVLGTGNGIYYLTGGNDGVRCESDEDRAGWVYRHPSDDSGTERS